MSVNTETKRKSARCLPSQFPTLTRTLTQSLEKCTTGGNRAHQHRRSQVAKQIKCIQYSFALRLTWWGQHITEVMVKIIPVFYA